MVNMMTRLKTYLLRRKRSYERTFRTDTGDEVLRDLARFCRAHSSTFDADPRVAAVLEGRREVYLRIVEHLHLTEEELWELRRPDPSGNHSIVQTEE